MKQHEVLELALGEELAQVEAPDIENVVAEAESFSKDTLAWHELNDELDYLKARIMKPGQVHNILIKADERYQRLCTHVEEAKKNFQRKNPEGKVYPPARGSMMSEQWKYLEDSRQEYLMAKTNGFNKKIQARIDELKEKNPEIMALIEDSAERRTK